MAAPPRPPVPTLADLRRSSAWLWLNCAAGCGHYRPVALAPFIIRYGAAASSDIWRAAHLLVKRHGADAATVAAQRADELLAEGDVEGQLVWKRIVSAISELKRTKMAENERRH